MQTYDKGELAKNILLGLAAGGFIIAACALPGLPQVMTLFHTKDSDDRARILRAIRRLQKRKLIRVFSREGEDVVEITQVGKKKVLAYRFDEMHIAPQKKVDGMWRVVMFDIPESKRGARLALSHWIKEVGMYAIQKSVFVSPYPCKNEIDFLGEFFGVRTHIIYMEAKMIDGEERVRKHFGL